MADHVLFHPQEITDKIEAITGTPVGEDIRLKSFHSDLRHCIIHDRGDKLEIGDKLASNIPPNDFDRLLIVGSGNVAWYIYRIAEVVGYETTLIDNMPETLTRERFPTAREILLGDILELLDSYEITGETSIVLASHKHKFDKQALVRVINSPARYIGVLGNRHKVTDYFNQLISMGVSEERISRVHVPVGLDLGGQRAAEIALAAVAEIQAVKYGRSGGFLTVKKAVKKHQVRDELF